MNKRQNAATMCRRNLPKIFSKRFAEKVRVLRQQLGCEPGLGSSVGGGGVGNGNMMGVSGGSGSSGGGGGGNANAYMYGGTYMGNTNNEKRSNVVADIPDSIVYYYAFLYI